MGGSYGPIDLVTITFFVVAEIAQIVIEVKGRGFSD